MIAISPSLPEEKGCLEELKESILLGWHFVWEKGGLVFQGITHLFFQAVGFFYPGFGDRAEAWWGHVTTVWTRLRAEYREAGLQQSIGEMRQQNADLSCRLQELIPQIDQLREEILQLKAERDCAIKTEEECRRALIAERAAQVPLHADLSHLTLQLDLQTKECVRLKTVSDEGRGELATEVEKRISLERESIKLKEQHRALNSQLDQKIAELERLKDTLRTHSSLDTAVKGENRVLHVENEHLKRALAEAIQARNESLAVQNQLIRQFNDSLSIRQEGETLYAKHN